jgi:hypothetical protein
VSFATDDIFLHIFDMDSVEPLLKFLESTSLTQNRVIIRNLEKMLNHIAMLNLHACLQFFHQPKRKQNWSEQSLTV